MSATTLDPAAFNARRAEIAAEISALTGVSLEIAGIAAGSFLTFPTDPQYGLSAGAAPVGKAWEWGDALDALRAWVAAQDQRRAA